MKNITLFLSLFAFSYGFSQSLPIHFEGDVTTSDFVSFDGGAAAVTANPKVTAANSSSSVSRIVRDGGAIFAGAKILLTDNLDFSVKTKLSMKVYTTAPAGTIVKFKLEGDGANAEVDAFTTVSGQWETLEWIFAGIAYDLNEIVFMFDFGKVGDGSATSTFYFDDIQQVLGPPAPVPASLPIDFENGVVSTDFLNFSGSTASVISNPQKSGLNTTNTVCQIVRDGGDFWGGSKILLNSNLDLSTNWQISMKVYTTAPIGTRIKLELEKTDGKSNLDFLTTVSGQWETASWNFHGQPNDFNRLTFMFDFGKVGDGSETSTFLFDDVQQVSGPAIPEPLPTSLPIDFEASVVTSDFINVNGAITTVIANPKMDSDNPSATVCQFVRSGGAPWAQSKLVLKDFMDYATQSTISMKVYTDAPVGTLLKLKVESTDAGFANEKNVNTTVSGAWATYTWDFSGDPPVYNVLTFMLGYATPNDASKNATFLFDDIKQIKSTLSSGKRQFLPQDNVYAYPNPATDHLTIVSDNTAIETITVFDLMGNQLAVLHPNSNSITINVSEFASGVYIAKYATHSGTGSFRFIVE
jgi:hypothetical protein